MHTLWRGQSHGQASTSPARDAVKSLQVGTRMRFATPAITIDAEVGSPVKAGKGAGNSVPVGVLPLWRNWNPLPYSYNTNAIVIGSGLRVTLFVIPLAPSAGLTWLHFEQRLPGGWS